MKLETLKRLDQIFRTGSERDGDLIPNLGITPPQRDDNSLTLFNKHQYEAESPEEDDEVCRRQMSTGIIISMPTEGSIECNGKLLAEYIDWVVFPSRVQFLERFVSPTPQLRHYVHYLVTDIWRRGLLICVYIFSVFGRVALPLVSLTMSPLNISPVAV